MSAEPFSYTTLTDATYRSSEHIKGEYFSNGLCAVNSLWEARTCE